MIVLNFNKELIRIETWADIEARPGFTKDLDPNRHQLATIIGRYAFSERIRCGLSNCHTPHAKGYIVTTKDGLETNIGKDCGKSYFGVDFETLTRIFDQDITDKENRERLWSFSFRLDEIKQRIETLRKQPNGADWVFHSTRPLLEVGKTALTDVVRCSLSLVKNRTNTITVNREAFESEIEQLEVFHGRKLTRPYYIEEPVAIVDGIEALYPENDLRQLLVIEIEQEINKFEKQEIDTLSSSYLVLWSKWASGVEQTIERAEFAVEAGRRLLKPDNLKSFYQVIQDREQAERLKKFISTL